VAWQAVLGGFGQAVEAVEARFAAIDRNSPDTIHRARVALKQLRYAAETLAPVLPSLTPRRLEQLRRHQARMGRIQDATVLRVTVDKYLTKHEERVVMRDRVRARLDRRVAMLIASFLRSSERLRHPGGVRRLLGWRTEDPERPV
jgi:CHAD domain-containing protein